MKKDTGRPTKFTQNIFDSICEEISTTSKSLKVICKTFYISTVTFYKWMKGNEALINIYARAREAQAEILADEIIEIADNSEKDTIQTDTGELPNNEWIARSRLRVDARKWAASKLAPKKYGEKQAVDLNVKTEQPLFPD